LEDFLFILLMSKAVKTKVAERDVSEYKLRRIDKRS